MSSSLNRDDWNVPRNRTLSHLSGEPLRSKLASTAPTAERLIAGIVPLPGMQAPGTVQEFFTSYMEKHPQTADVVKLSLEKLEINLAMRQAAGDAPER